MSDANRRVAETKLIDLMIAMIEAEARRIAGGDFDAADKALGKQGLALDVLFAQLTREAAEDLRRGHEPMRLALSAQSQFRRTLTYLVSRGVGVPRPAEKAISRNPTRKLLKTGIALDDQAVSDSKRLGH